ncbi:class 1b ribonucleoside-diphosphate reductase subunit beta [Lacticigenium naphthae]|uniref:class 1b ribonucleoside-diphosphate reductase subunit beta n=1 Tax=Lacticigenium naphthae TaxID=515351 RepID=UPI0003FD1816|nr:class 1b ribonucleoside-diphosphate reductase subunit beta [Lacticigenium naphthae]
MKKYLHYQAIDWNKLEETIDKHTWEKLTSQFWLDTRIPVSNDLDDWRQLSLEERDVVNKAFGGLTLLDTLQSEVGASVMKQDVRTQHEEAVLNNILFMESVHAKSYSTIFISLNENRKIEEIFDWTNQNERLQYKAKRIKTIYDTGTPLQKKIASVFLESFLFYSGFYTPLWYLGNNQLPNVAEIIKLIIRDESVHGTYLGYKFQLGYKELTEEEQADLRDWMYSLLFDLLENEFVYTEELYDTVGWTQEVKVFVQYNANKALQNLGFESLFQEATEKEINPIVMNGLSTDTNNHDFFSQVGSGYLMGEVEAMEEDDYDF